MNIGRREFLKFIAFAGAIAAMGFSGCVSPPEPMPN
ncbi:MAG: twin-arginine translocation signal domain-containing protein, partial [Methanocellales archaeon]|nr:twin-arginine translocation signal domain-containing protein [Methanocellales archaeon]